MNAPDPREDNLPKWVRETLRSLRREVSDLRSRLDEEVALAEAVGGVVAWVDVYDEHPRPVAKDHEGVTFVLDGLGSRRRWFTVKLKGESLEVMASEAVLIRPHVTNLLTVELAR